MAYDKLYDQLYITVYKIMIIRNNNNNKDIKK